MRETYGSLTKVTTFKCWHIESAMWNFRRFSRFNYGFIYTLYKICIGIKTVNAQIKQELHLCLCNRSDMNLM